MAFRQIPKRTFLKLLGVFGGVVLLGRWSRAQFMPLTFWRKPTGYSCWMWGENASGELGVGDTTARSSPSLVSGGASWVQISTGLEYTLGVRNDGTLWSWGKNHKSQLGLGDTVSRSTPCQVGSATNWSSVHACNSAAAAINSLGQLFTWGNHERGTTGQGLNSGTYTTPVQVGTLTHWATLGGGALHLMGATSGGALYAWGRNNVGRLGVGDSTDRSSPTQVGALTNWASADGSNIATCFFKTDGTLWSCGSDFAGIPGQGASYTTKSSPVQIGTATDWQTLTVGDVHCLSLKTSSKTLWGWGHNIRGNLSLGTTTSVSQPTQIGAANWSDVAAGGTTTNAFSLFIKSDGTLWSCGSNTSGQLGKTSGNVSSMVQVGTLTDWASVFGGMNAFGGGLRRGSS